MLEPGLGRTQQDLAELSAVLGLVGHGLERRAYIVQRRTFSGLVDVGGGPHRAGAGIGGLVLTQLTLAIYGSGYCLRYRLTALLAA